MEIRHNGVFFWNRGCKCMIHYGPELEQKMFMLIIVAMQATRCYRQNLLNDILVK